MKNSFNSSIEFEKEDYAELHQTIRLFLTGCGTMISTAMNHSFEMQRERSAQYTRERELDRQSEINDDLNQKVQQMEWNSQKQELKINQLVDAISSLTEAIHDAKNGK